MGAVDGDDAQLPDPARPGIGGKPEPSTFWRKEQVLYRPSRGRSGSKGEVVKRIHLFTLLSVFAVALSVGLLPGVAEASGGGGSTNQVTIQPQASYIFASAVINVGLDVKCQGGSGNVVVNVTQSAPASPLGGASGSGTSPVSCDGQMHPVAVTVTGFGFGAGQAWATADLTAGSPTVVAHNQRSIDIVVVTG